ncbi:hypothetical protein ACIP1T_28405 [Pseudomonas japonica]|uniref:hypothetical protein n=1 Tax=Pseudomonas japonica TaxID=256466 RepID=UPI0037F67320
MDELKAGNCSCAALREQGNFSGWGDFHEFIEVLNSSLDFDLVPVLSPYSNVGLIEFWYKCRKCHQVWRLIEPDPPFAGYWGEI